MVELDDMGLHAEPLEETLDLHGIPAVPCRDRHI
jgi:hypothetical protein